MHTWKGAVGGRGTGKYRTPSAKFQNNLYYKRVCPTKNEPQQGISYLERERDRGEREREIERRTRQRYRET
jgi:hypothetical protein